MSTWSEQGNLHFNWYIRLHHCIYIVHTCLYMVQTCLSCFMSVHGSSHFTCFCWKHFLDVRLPYSPVLCCTRFRQCYGTGISHLLHAGYVDVWTRLEWFWQAGSFPVLFSKNRVCQWLSTSVLGRTLLSDVCTAKWENSSEKLPTCQSQS